MGGWGDGQEMGGARLADSVRPDGSTAAWGNLFEKNIQLLFVL